MLARVGEWATHHSTPLDKSPLFTGGFDGNCQRIHQTLNPISAQVIAELAPGDRINRAFPSPTTELADTASIMTRGKFISLVPLVEAADQLYVDFFVLPVRGQI